MISVPAIERWGDVYGPIDERRVERDCKRKKAQRNISQREGERKRIERAGGQAGQNERHDQQAVTVDQWKESADQRKYRRGVEQNFPRSQQGPHKNSERPDEHQCNVEGAAEPRSVVEADSDGALEIRKPERNHAPGERDNPRAHDHSQDSEQRTLGKFRGRYCREAMRDLFWWR